MVWVLAGVAAYLLFALAVAIVVGRGIHLGDRFEGTLEVTW